MLMLATVAFLALSTGVLTNSVKEDELMNTLFMKYTRDIRPTVNPSDTLNVTLGMSLIQIINVWEKKQVFVLRCLLKLIWYTPMLKWQPSNYGNISSLNINPERIWRPDIVLYNNADEDMRFGGNLQLARSRVILSHNGTTTWFAPLILKSKCKINIRYFPFDSHSCSLKFGSWTYDGGQLDLQKETDSIDTDPLQKHVEWQVTDTGVSRHVEKYYCCPELYPDITFTINCTRYPRFYILNLLYPISVIGFLGAISFLLPIETVERNNFATNLLVTMLVFMLIVANFIPESGEVIPLVQWFFGASVLELTIILALLAYITRLHHKNTYSAPMSNFIRKVFVNGLSRLIFTRNINECETQYVTLEVPNTYVFSEKNPTEADMLIKRLDTIVDKVKSLRHVDKVHTDWKIAAVTVDRCLMVIILLCVLANIIAVIVYAT